MVSKTVLFCLAVILGAVVCSTVTNTPGRVSQQSDSGDDGAHGTQMRRRSPDVMQRELKPLLREGQSGENAEEVKEIHPINEEFLQGAEDWEREGKGISFDSSGEPKSGTTWDQRVITSLAVNLCGSYTNPWCRMGGLKVFPSQPAPWYEFEMIEANTSKLFMHFKGTIKHKIRGFDVGGDCNPNGRTHCENFELYRPCVGQTPGPMTREKLSNCLPVTSPRCAQLLPSQDPAVSRMSVIFRDPRNVVISERRMRINVYKMKGVLGLDAFIHERLEVIVSWMYMRWVWHTTYLANVSHVMFYEDLEENPLGFASLAKFMGLDCSPEQAQSIWDANRYESRAGGYNSYGLPTETIEWMNVTMATLLPEPMVKRWGLTPIFPDAP